MDGGRSGGWSGGRQRVEGLPGVRALEEKARQVVVRQDGVATTAQLESWGVRRDTVARRVTAGDWQRLFRGVVVLQSGPTSWRQQARAALLYAGPGAALTHRSAAYHHGVLRDPGPVMHVTVPHGRTVMPQRGLVVHRTRRVRWSGGVLPAVEPAEAVLDMLADLDASPLSLSPARPTPEVPAHPTATPTRARVPASTAPATSTPTRAAASTAPATSRPIRAAASTAPATSAPIRAAASTSPATSGPARAATSAPAAPARVGRDVTDAVVGLVCDAVRGGVQPGTLLLFARRRSRLPGRELLLAMLDEVRAGVESPLELRFARDVERAHGLPRGVAQRWERVDGRWIRADRVYVGFGVRAELDGSLAHPFGATDDDVWRDNAVLVTSGDTTLRYRWRHVAVTPCATAVQLVAALRTRGWRGTPRPCSPTCPLTAP